MNRFFLASLACLPLVASLAVGCAAPTDAEDTEESAVESQELTTTAKKLVGNYYDHAVPQGGIARLELHANGRYEAQVDPAGKIVCVMSPCLLPESGTWNATPKAGGGYKLRLRPQGQPSRIYDATRSATDLTLARAGKSQTLTALGNGQCLDDGDCGANETCGPKVCLMYCLVNDPFCCGPSTCQPKAKMCGGIAGIACAADEICVDDPNDGCDPTKGGADCSGTCQKKPTNPPPACFGAWLDQNGTCRTPADGVYPDSCCAGMTTDCGPSKCGVGETCCNPLSGICTKPGMFCAM
jgi:hypothetical protein